MSKKTKTRRIMFRPAALFKFALLSMAASVDPPLQKNDVQKITTQNSQQILLDSRAGPTEPRSRLLYGSGPSYGVNYGDKVYGGYQKLHVPESLHVESFKSNYDSPPPPPPPPPAEEYGDSRAAARRLHDRCYSDHDCRNVHYSACRAGYCECTETLYVEAATGLRCLRRSRLGVPCEQNDQCDSLVEHSHCYGGFCRCTVGFVPFGSLECVAAAKWLHEPCIVQDQCAALGVGAVCYAGRCECDPAYFVAASSGGGGLVVGGGGVPQPAAAATIACLYKRKLGESCLTSEQCASRVWQSTCNSGICTCEPNSVPIGKEQCVAVAPALGEPCTVDNQCTTVSVDAVCIQGTCQCSDGTIQQSGSDTVCLGADALLNDPCVESSQCTANNSLCISNICSCDDGFTQFDVTNLCLADVPFIGDPCTVSSQCAVDNTFCNPATQTCECLANFVADANGESCITGALIGSPCSVNAQCSTRTPQPPGVGVPPSCINNICSCLPGTVADILLNVCLPQCLSVGGPCISTVQCRNINRYNVFICAYDPIVSGTVCTVLP